jgi:PAS domain S-box-containing protein
MGRYRLLVVDDDPAIIALFAEVFDATQFEVVGAGDGAEALTLLQSVDIIFSDLNMHTLDGLALLEQAREKAPDVPFIIMTGYSDKSKLVRAVQLGAFEFIEKPFMMRDIEALTERALRQRKLYRDRRQSEAHTQSIERFSRLINATRTLDELFDCLRRELAPALGARTFSLFLCDRAKERLVFSCSNRLSPETSLNVSIERPSWPSLGGSMNAPSAEGSSATIPMLIRGDLIGVLFLSDKLAPPLTVEPIDLTFFAIAAGHVASAIAVRQEALELENALSELKKSRTMLVEAQAIAHLGNWHWELATNELSWSEELYRIYGVDSKVVPREAFPLDRIHPADHAMIKEKIEAVFRTGQPTTFEHRVVFPGGSRPMHNQVRAVLNADGIPTEMVGTVQDITERKSLEARLLLADRMASTGTLAAGVAHEVNNPLAYVMSNLEFISAELADLALEHPTKRLMETRRALTDSLDGTARVARIVRDLKTFSRADEESRGAVDLHQVLESSLKMASNEIRHRARLVKDFGDLPPILGNEARLGQVFLNLMVNAAQAMPMGKAAENEVRLTTRMDAAGSRAIVEVKDTGSGIPPEIMNQIFDPFFTTKPIGAGTGLGLSICHGIISELGGQISVESQVGVGTTFRVALPLHPAMPAGGPESAMAMLSEIAVRRRVLIIDDEPLVGVALQRMLSSEHEVVTEESAQLALGRIDAGEKFDVILCDLMMPDVSGIDFYEALQRAPTGPGQRVIFMTGGAFTPSARDFLARVSAPVLGKPIDRQLLRSLLRAGA